MDRLHGDVTAIDRALVGHGPGHQSTLSSTKVRSSTGTGTGIGAGEEQLLFASSMCTEQRTEVVTGLASQLQHLQDSNWSYSRPPLMWAVHNGLPHAVKDMLFSSSSTTTGRGGSSTSDPVNAADGVGRTALHECAALLHARTLIHQEASTQIAEILLLAGANVNATSVSGRTPLHEVFCMNQDDAISCYRLSYQGVSAICQNTAKLGTSSSSSFSSSGGGYTNHSGHGASSSYPTSSSSSLVPSASPSIVSVCRRQMVRLLLRMGADPLIPDRQGMAAIHYCAREDLYDCMLEMIRAG